MACWELMRSPLAAMVDLHVRLRGGRKGERRKRRGPTYKGKKERRGAYSYGDGSKGGERGRKGNFPNVKLIIE